MNRRSKVRSIFVCSPFYREAASDAASSVGERCHSILQLTLFEFSSGPKTMMFAL